MCATHYIMLKQAKKDGKYNAYRIRQKSNTIIAAHDILYCATDALQTKGTACSSFLLRVMLLAKSTVSAH